ncbi:MarR family winged helix-turn-helix transcriptional regulator [Rhodopirellula sp. SWK7]|uniref:MarR family winged helix-turn-helix transcriptional regulator n=1 Tax=Rhodopirellula sp. SWK7 TaxID=595460 RepID=UPI0002BE8F57|nr:MarR family transcriptional regulator [Rhodopirellula sp. SWK7]EMI42098.1 Bacterial regulatory protein, MarR [Rhodopirellula sp. SWK7]
MGFELPSATVAPTEDNQISLFLGRAYYSYLGMLARHLKLRQLDDKLQPGIGNLLFALFRQDDQTASEIATRLGLARSTMTGLVKRVRKLGLVTTRPDPSDGRAIRMSLTPEARALMPDCFSLAEHMESVICRDFSTSEREVIASLLMRATENINRELASLGNDNAPSAEENKS